MEPLLALLAGVLFAAGTYLILRRNQLRMIFGIVLLGNAVNVLLMAAGRLTWGGRPALVPEGADVPPEPFANPLPQALVLTAIVIGFGLTAFTLVLIYRSYQTHGTLDQDDLADEEPAPEPAHRRAVAEGA